MSTDTAHVPEPKRIRQLDGIRGLAILAILIWHYGVCLVTSDTPSYLRVVLRPFALTWSGVDLFFVLSGFLITSILIRAKHGAHPFSAFYIRRAFRILPLYWLLLLSYLFVSETAISRDPRFIHLFACPLPFASYATFTQNLFMGFAESWGPHWIAITWSLAVEEQFYLVAPLLIILLPRNVLVWIVVGGIVAASILRAQSPGFHAYISTPWRMDSLLLGSLLSLIIQDVRSLEFARRHSPLLMALSAALILISGYWMLFDLAISKPHLPLGLAFAIGIMQCLANPGSRMVRIFSHRWLVWFGLRSYSIYLFHQAVNGVVYGYLRGAAPQIHSLTDIGVQMVSLSLTLLLAEATYRWIEQPSLRFAHRFKY